MTEEALEIEQDLQEKGYRTMLIDAIHGACTADETCNKSIAFGSEFRGKTSWLWKRDGLNKLETEHLEDIYLQYRRKGIDNDL